MGDKSFKKNVQKHHFLKTILLTIKSKYMATDKGKPSGVNKSDGTGVPQNIQPVPAGGRENDQEKYINEDGEISEHVRTNNPNRNVDKEDATNAGGYKN